MKESYARVMKYWMKTKVSGKMKVMKKLFAAACAAAIALVSCQEESFDGQHDSDNYYASVESFGSDTRTALGEGRTVVWSSEDRIAIFEGGNVGQAYQVLDSYIGKSTGEFTSVDGLTTSGAVAAIDGTIAIYPFEEGITVSSGDNGDYVIEGVDFPSEQKYVADSFSDEAFPMVSLSASGSRNLSFKNIGGILKLSLTGSYAISKIMLTGNSEEPLSGSATVTLGSDGIPSVTMSEDASTSVSLLCSPAVQLEPDKATDFYISIPPTEFEGGFTAIIIDKDGKEHGIATHKSNSIERSYILAMPESTPESLDDIKLTADTFCSVDFIEGWTETRFGGDGTIVFVKEDEQGKMTHSLMFLPDEENILLPVYIRFDENEMPSYMSFMDTEIYIDGYTDSTIDFTLAVEDAVWSIQDVAFNELTPDTPQTRAWADNNAIRNACAIGNLVVSAAGVAGGVVMISASVIGEVMTAGASTPISVAGIALGVINIKSGWDSIIGSLETIFGPAEQEQSTYVKDGLMGIGMEKLSDAIQNAPKKDFIKKILPAYLLKDPADLGKLNTISYWSGFIFSSIDEEWGQTYTGPVNLAQVHQDVKVVTGRADNITTDSAELYGYVSPLATAPLGERILTEIYIVLWKAGDNNNKRHHSIFNSDGGTISFTFSDLEPDTEYCYQTIFEDIENKIYRFGEVNTFKTTGEPDCITGNASCITTTSAVVECTYSNVPEDGQCQVILSWDEGHRVINAENSEGTQSITLSDLKPNTTYSYYASIDYDEGPVNGEMKEFKTNEENERWVDLGLSVLWAAYNVGANSPEEYGGYYAWGETEEKDRYTYENYKHGYVYYYGSEPYEWDFIYNHIGNEISGTSYDVAHTKWGDGAKLPSLDKIQELVDNCTFTHGTYGDVNGNYITGPNGNSIFIPFAGRYFDWGYSSDDYVNFWSGTYHGSCLTDHGYSAYCLDAGIKDCGIWAHCSIAVGIPVRPVKDK